MPTRVRPDRTITAAVAALALTGCGFAEDNVRRKTATRMVAGEANPAQTRTLPESRRTSSREKDCLLLIWEQQSGADRAFDLRFDEAPGGNISCATGTTAGEFDKAIHAIRSAAAGPDRAALLDHIGVPLTYIDRDGTSRQLADRGAVDVLFRRIFDEDVLSALRELDLAEMAVTPGQGGDFHLGSVWLAVREEAGRPQIVTINQQALAEARGVRGLDDPLETAPAESPDAGA